MAAGLVVTGIWPALRRIRGFHIAVGFRALYDSLGANARRRLLLHPGGPMRRSHWLIAFLFAATSAHAAAVSPPGVNLRSDNCYGDRGVQYKQFACDRNTGSERLAMSFHL